jgi:Family of unknown function (DUF5343)
MAESDAKKNYPMLPISHWWTLRKKFRQSLPGIVTDSYLATVLNMDVNSARANVLPFLKTLGIIDSEGKPLPRAKLWRDDEHYAEVCKAILKEVYPEELISAVTDPVNEKVKARRWFAQRTGVGEAASNRMVSLYSVLVEADASKEPEEKKNVPKASASKVAAKSQKRVQGLSDKPVAVESDKSGQGNSEKGHSTLKRGPDVNINLQIHISSDASPDQIEQIFSSMSKHLYKNA